MSDQVSAPAGQPLDAERAKFRAAGYTESEISQILIARMAGGQPAAAVAGQGVMSAVLSSIVGIASHARALLPNVKNDVATIFDRAAPTPARALAAASLLVIVVVVTVLAYAGWQEWQQHIIAATKIANTTVAKIHAEECKARSDAIIATVPMNHLDEAYAQLAKDCDPTYPERQAREEAAVKQCAVKFQSVLVVVETLDFKAADPTKAVSAAIDGYKAECTVTDEQREAAKAAFAKRQEKIDKIVAALKAIGTTAPTPGAAPPTGISLRNPDAPPRSPSYMEGAAEWGRWKTWLDQQSEDARAGAEYWASIRNDTPRHASIVARMRV